MRQRKRCTLTAWQSRFPATGGRPAMSPPSWASRRPRSGPMWPVARCPRPTGASAASLSGGPRRSADGTPSDHAVPAAQSNPDNRDHLGTSRHFAPPHALRCRIEPYIDQARRLAAPLARRQRPGSAFGGPPGARRAEPGMARRSRWPTRRPVQCMSVPGLRMIRLAAAAPVQPSGAGCDQLACGHWPVTRKDHGAREESGLQNSLRARCHLGSQLRGRQRSRAAGLRWLG